MSVNLVVNGFTYVYPETNDVNWGANTTAWASAVTTGMLQKQGGAFTLTNEVDFGSGFGVKSTYYKSRTANIASGGILRLANNSDAISWRNAANNANLDLIVNASDQLSFNGTPLLTSALADPGGNGIVARTAVNTTTNRTITAGTGISVNDGDGVAGNPTISSTITQYTDEDAQDAVGNILTDTSSIDFTYNDVGNTISAVVLPAGVDHNSLNNFVANKHVDHSGVTLTAGVGLTGGGDITTSRTFDVATLKGSTTYDFPSIPGNANDTTTIGVTGAVIGDPVALGRPTPTGTGDVHELTFQAYVSAADTVTLNVVNATPVAVDLDSATYNVIVFKFSEF